MSKWWIRFPPSRLSEAKMIDVSIQQYQDAFAAIDEYFGGVISGGGVDLMLDVYWHFDNGSIQYDHTKFTPHEDTDEADFSLEVRNNGAMFWPKDRYSLAYVDNCCGQEYYIVLDNNKRLW